MNNIEILEELADNEHNRWANWQKYVHSKCMKNEDGSLTIPKEYVEHWNYEINTKYKNLPENIKENDRNEVRQILKLLNVENLIQENKELKENLKIATAMLTKGTYPEQNKGDNDFCKQFIPKSKVKEKIEELYKEQNKYTGYKGLEFSRTGLINAQIQILQELLEEGE